MADDPVPEYDINFGVHAPPGNVVVIESDDDDNDEDYDPAPWGVRLECSASPKHVALGIALVCSAYVLNCLMWALVR